MNFSSLFSSAPQQQAAPAQQQQQPAADPQQQPTQPGAMQQPATSPTQQSPAADANGVVPKQEENKDPLAAFATLWDTKPNDSNNADPNAPFVPLNAEDLQKVVAKSDFSQAVNQETLQAITAGGEGAAKAFTDALNAVAQQTLYQATMVGNKLTEQAVRKAMEQQQSKIPGLVREHATSSHMANSNALYSNPAIKPVVDAARSSLMTQYPNETPQQIATRVDDYMKAMAQQFNPQTPTNNNGGNEVDWEKYFQS